MPSWLTVRLRSWLGGPVEHDLGSYRGQLAAINARETDVAALSDAALRERARALHDGTRADSGEEDDDPAAVVEGFALVREAARRALGERPFDVQVLAGLAMLRGRVAQLATGEGKTLAAVAPVCLRALRGRGAHVLTFNDYLARRDALWMEPVYRALGFEVGFVQERMAPAERRLAYGCDITYLTAKEAGFDHLRDGLALQPEDLVQRPFHFALVDEADSILIDEARIPLVIAGDSGRAGSAVERMAALAGRLRPGVDFDTDEYQHNIALTETGAARVETALGCANLYSAECRDELAALRNALHAEHLLRRDVDYVVRGGKVELVDDFTGRVADKRRWPDGLQAAIEAKEGVRLQAEGSILASITLQHFIGLYPLVCGMTATAESSAEELDLFYGLPVAVIPPHRPMVRIDHPDVVFTHRAAKHAALVREIEAVHGTGRPILVGTGSVRESETLAGMLAEASVPCTVLNAKNDEAEAAVIARAGAVGAVTISTNMAGRGTDIRLGGPDEAQRDAVVAAGGLLVVGTNRHASLRVDMQLRGRAGRQGDPGASRFFVSLEDDLIERYGVQNLITVESLPARQDGPIGSRAVGEEIARAQRIIEGESYEIRKTLHAYSEPVEAQRLSIRERRQAVLVGEAPNVLASACPEAYARAQAVVDPATLDAVERRVRLVVIDRCWSDYLAEVAEMRDDSHLLAFAGRYPLAEFHREVGRTFLALEARIDGEVARTFEGLDLTAAGVDWQAAGLRAPASTWTYLIGENPFGANAMHASPTHRPSFVYAVLALGPLALVPTWLARRRRRERARAAEALRRPDAADR